MKKLTRDRVVPIISANVLPRLRLAKVRHQQQDARQPSLAGIEQLIDQVGLRPDPAVQHEVEKQRGERLLLVQGTQHQVAIDAEHRARHQRRGSGGPKCVGTGERLFAKEVSCRKERDRGLLALLGNNRQLGPPRPQIENRVGRPTLRKEDVLGFDTDDLSSFSLAVKVFDNTEWLRRFKLHERPPNKYRGIVVDGAAALRGRRFVARLRSIGTHSE